MARSVTCGWWVICKYGADCHNCGFNVPGRSTSDRFLMVFDTSSGRGCHDIQKAGNGDEGGVTGSLSSSAEPFSVALSILNRACTVCKATSVRRSDARSSNAAKVWALMCKGREMVSEDNNTPNRA